MKKIISFFVILLSILNFPFSAHSTEKKLKIAMVLWRGITDAEKGFQEGLKESGYLAEYTILDAKLNRKQFANVLRKELLPRLNEFYYIY